MESRIEVTLSQLLCSSKHFQVFAHFLESVSGTLLFSTVSYYVNDFKTYILFLSVLMLDTVKEIILIFL